MSKSIDEKIAEGFEALNKISVVLRTLRIDSDERRQALSNRDFIIQHLFRLHVPMVELMVYM
jgi:hypothetical protein